MFVVSNQSDHFNTFFVKRNTIKERAQVPSSTLCPSASFHIKGDNSGGRTGTRKRLIFEVRAVLLCRLLLLASMLFGALGVVLEEQAERSEAKQKGLEKPHAASGCVVDTFVAAGQWRRNNKKK